ncbi:uncharacterized protein BO96DRAFT_408268 [Aspergillus niger CBS 101883]|uniref:uncharacterized protein n=1 Tax=Aspergillus lacticoffeatus (strain CBS 101883) TaxID=1450533 RepID=UPI000D804DAC|nr:uncharacterized protein BO96DRAFT_408268 [Aspergillus niger CBS 101883]PYH61457.1 hypothetical protein BO96DRAFT_408268 [Aspergillus niger CBS 101883]
MSSQGIGIFAGLVAGFHSSFDLSTLFSYSFLSLCKSQCKVYHCITPGENPSNPFVAKQWQKYQILSTILLEDEDLSKHLQECIPNKNNNNKYRIVVNPKQRCTTYASHHTFNLIRSSHLLLPIN